MGKEPWVQSNSNEMEGQNTPSSKSSSGVLGLEPHTSPLESDQCVRITKANKKQAQYYIAVNTVFRKDFLQLSLLPSSGGV